MISTDLFAQAKKRQLENLRTTSQLISSARHGPTIVAKKDSFRFLDTNMGITVCAASLDIPKNIETYENEKMFFRPSMEDVMRK